MSSALDLHLVPVVLDASCLPACGWCGGVSVSLVLIKNLSLWQGLDWPSLSCLGSATLGHLPGLRIRVDPRMCLGTGAGIYSDNSKVNVTYALDSDKTALESLIGSSGSSHKLTFTQQ